MYIMWYFVFGTLALLILLGVFLIICIKKTSYYEKEYDKVSAEIDDAFDQLIRGDYKNFNENRENEKKLRLKRATLSDKQHKWDKISFAPGVPCVILTAMLIIFTLVSILAPICAKFDVEDYKATYEMYESVSEGQSDVENIALSETANKYNQWLRNARLNKKRFGAFSKYYNQDLENLKYIGEK